MGMRLATALAASFPGPCSGDKKGQGYTAHLPNTHWITQSDIMETRL